jgi:hypothetical protein
LKPATIDRLEKPSKDAIEVAHARPLSESRQPDRTGLHWFG